MLMTYRVSGWQQELTNNSLFTLSTADVTTWMGRTSAVCTHKQCFHEHLAQVAQQTGIFPSDFNEASRAAIVQATLLKNAKRLWLIHSD